MNHKAIEDLSALVLELPPDSIVSRSIFDDEQLKVVLFGFAKGQELSEHTSSHATVIQILRGDASITIGDDTFEVGAGAWFHMKPRVPHSVIAMSELLMLLTMLKT